ncbi:hypothetical protein F9L16_23410 [Agarivorans sp. B2Z047]|uniref:hypothetical protein n=1 Tax=Agarivorans sp. B2Z047 TaxID=2652721 RepID=UPI00128C0C72|nr:hypothetical protein [Agarivorans sp. B2Z047]MPW31907.1 hypothetical protein [Agarivorans sp. B2Z047]UQN44871.1 hypothetical protein LQZ07_10525 [Agarivorans sp. B2Z047]
MSPKKMDPPRDMQLGMHFETIKHGTVTVIEYYNTHTIVVAFNNTGNIRATTAAKLRRGDVVDRNVPAQSSMVGNKIMSASHGQLTIVKVEDSNIVVLESEDGEEVRMLMAKVKKFQETYAKLHEDIVTNKENKPKSLDSLTKRSKKAKDVNKILNNMIKNYGE